MGGRGSNGRPLRFLAVTLGGWTAARVVLLWPAAPVAMPLPVPTLVEHLRSPVAIARPTDHDGHRRLATVTERSPGAPSPMPAPERSGGRLAPAAPVAPAPIAPPQAERGVIPPPLRPTPIAPALAASGRSRWAGSAWAIVRGGGGGGSAGALLAGQLGASQAGARLTYALGERRRVALSARIATPLSGRGREAAIGLDWQPTRMPLHLLAEQRLPLDGQRGGPTLMLVGGINPTPVLAGFRLEGYGQAGAIKREGTSVEAFGDGAARLTRVVASVGPARIDLGGGAWGAAQRGVRRLDIGPTVGAAVPVAGTALRLTLDWRQRLAGNARPGSGPALSIGTDF